MKTNSVKACTSQTSLVLVEGGKGTLEPDAPLPPSSSSCDPAKDEWLGVCSTKTRDIPGTPYFLSRLSAAVHEGQQEQRLNAHGYDMDEPKDAIAKYERAHPKSIGQKIRNFFSDTVFNFFTIGIPAALSASAGSKKQRIDQKVLLNIVRESVDKFPELKIRMAKEAFERLDAKDQRAWHEKMSIIRAAQHDFIANELAKVYPNHINLDAPTILYSGGRATGLLRVLYCSVDEYVALYWSDWGLSSTDSGSYRSHVYDYITEGHNINWNARYLEYKPSDYEITEPGEYTFLGEGDRKIWSFEGPCGMVDHGIGDIPSMLKFATVSNVTSTLNFHAIGTLLSTQAAAVAHEYWQRFKDAIGVTTVSVEPIAQVDERELKEARGYFARILERA